MAQVTPKRRRRAAIVASVLALAVLGAACQPRPSAAPPPASGGSGVVGDLVARHNSARAQAGLPGFVVDGQMNAYAQLHANRLAANGAACSNLWHSSELGRWYAGHSAGENVACVSPCTGDGARLMSSWLSSPPHRANIFNGGFRYLGVGAVCNGRTLFAVAQFRN